jgi:hypothetical protein
MAAQDTANRVAELERRVAELERDVAVLKAFRNDVYWRLWASAYTLLGHYSARRRDGAARGCFDRESWRCVTARLGARGKVLFRVDRAAARRYGLPNEPPAGESVRDTRGRHARMAWDARYAAAFAHFARHVDRDSMRAVDKFGNNHIRWFAVDRAKALRNELEKGPGGRVRATQRRAEFDKTTRGPLRDEYTAEKSAIHRADEVSDRAASARVIDTLATKYARTREQTRELIKPRAQKSRM